MRNGRRAGIVFLVAAGIGCGGVKQDPGQAAPIGTCGRSCQGATCVSAACQPVVLASGQSHPEGIAVDSTNVYWTTGGLDATGTVMKVPIGGGIPVTLASGPGAFGIAVDATTVYWINGGASGSVMKVPIGGGTPVTLASALNFPGFLAVDSANVYFPANGPVMKIPIGGGIPTTLASAAAGSGIAVDATSVYWTDGFSTANGSVMKQPSGGGSPVSLATGQDYAAFVAVDGASVYWTDDRAGTVMKVPVTGGTPVTLASGQVGAWGIAVDEASVYWTNGGATGTTVMKVPIGGGTPITLASGQHPLHIAVDATSVYWTDYVDGTVMKIVKE